MVTVEPSDLSAAAPSPPPDSREQRIPELSLGGYNTGPSFSRNEFWRSVIPRSLGRYNTPRVSLSSPRNVSVSIARPKDRVAYILLGIFLGMFGAHNFYAGYTARALGQLAITLCTLFVGAIVSWIWAIVEICIIDWDSRNISMI